MEDLAWFLKRQHHTQCNIQYKLDHRIDLKNIESQCDDVNIIRLKKKTFKNTITVKVTSLSDHIIMIRFDIQSVYVVIKNTSQTNVFLQHILQLFCIHETIVENKLNYNIVNIGHLYPSMSTKYISAPTPREAKAIYLYYYCDHVVPIVLNVLFHTSTSHFYQLPTELIDVITSCYL